MNRLSRILFLASILVLIAPAVASASTLTVTTTADDTIVDGFCSLREALGVLGGAASADCGTNTGAATIAFSLPDPSTITIASADNPFLVSTNVTIAGPGATKLIIDGNDLSTIFTFGGGVTATISGMTLQHSKFRVSSAFSAAIFNNGNLTVSGLRLLDNNGGFGVGGAIRSGDTLLVKDTLFQGNTAGSGGAVYAANGATKSTFINCSFVNNQATGGAGGALVIDNYSPVGIFGSVFSGNTGTMGGGAAVINHEATLLDVSFIGNSTGGTGGALFLANTGGKTQWLERVTFSGNSAGGSGGAVYVNNGGIAVFTNTTFSGNSAGTDGGAFDAYPAVTIGFNNVTMTGNTATGKGGGFTFSGGSLTVRNSIVSANTNGGASPDCYTPVGKTITSGGHNFFGSVTGCTVSAATDTTGASLNLGVIGAHGGAALGWDGAATLGTLMPGFSSAAIDGGDPAGCAIDAFPNAAPPSPWDAVVHRADLDARRGARPILVCDAGAVETSCGDGNVDAGEECDDANSSNGDGCVHGCKNAYCGDGYTRVGLEQCDDGNSSPLDDCPVTCELPYCGDGFVWAGHEGCDEGQNNTTACAYGTLSCTVCAPVTCQSQAGTVSYCGDSAIDDANGETCDNGAGNTTACAYGAMSCMVCSPTTCTQIAGTTSYCGDGSIDGAHGETCDDGNTTNGDGCSSTCQTEPMVDMAEPPDLAEAPADMATSLDAAISPRDLATGDEPDAATAGTSVPDEGRGCGCTVGARPPTTGAPWWAVGLAAVGVLLLRRRRARG